jgi:hypothetical protein
MFAGKLYTALGAAPDAKISARFTHNGLAGRTLKSASSNRQLSVNPKAHDQLSETEMVIVLGDIKRNAGRRGSTRMRAHVHVVRLPRVRARGLRRHRASVREGRSHMMRRRDAVCDNLAYADTGTSADSKGAASPRPPRNSAARRSSFQWCAVIEGLKVSSSGASASFQSNSVISSEPLEFRARPSPSRREPVAASKAQIPTALRTICSRA